MKTLMATLGALAFLTGSAAAQMASRPVPTGIDVKGPTCHGYDTMRQRYVVFDCGSRVVVQNSLNNRPMESGRVLWQGGGDSGGDAGSPGGSGGESR
jgi:hypothetical protein